MKRIIFFLILATVYGLLPTDAVAQSRTNTLTRPCPAGTTPTKATVSIAVGGSITATPCSTQTATINGVAISSTNSPTVLRSYLASSVTYNNVDVLADTALSVTVAASGIYDIEVLLHTDNVAATALKVDFGGTSTQTNFIGNWGGFELPLAIAASTIGNVSRVTSAGTDFANGPDGANAFYTFRGTVEVNAAGTFLVRGAQSGAAVGNTTILRGSTLTLTKLN